MENNDTVPMGIVVLIFAVLGILIICSFIFAGWSIFNLRNSAQGSVLALGKSVYFPEIEEDEDVYGDYEESFQPFALTIEVGNQSVYFGANEFKPEIIDGEIFVPVRGVFETMGYIGSWDEQSGVAMFSNNINTVIITMDENTFVANGEVQELPSPARNISDSAMFPLEPVMKSLGYIVSFDEESNTLFISEPPPPAPPQEPVPAQTPRPAAAARPRPAATPEPTPEPVVVACRTCNGGGTVTCNGCDGVGGGRSMMLTPGIPHEFAESGLQWWCTVCMAQTRITCATCNGSGLIVVPQE
ncbi:MAG: stalk domain-containing protein [Defluviitaleaceae bacterium]|nr:stalk domain-containing protein [Defluviitaleaceae bacterium]